jgi:D-3-phosphoglycerate dehydrogenase
MSASFRVAVLDDYHRMALQLADWSGLEADLVVFHENLAVPEEAAEKLADFDAVCLIRERMAMPRSLIQRLPRLKFIAVTGRHNRTLDLQACQERGIVASYSTSRGPGANGTPELTWALILAAARNVAFEDRAMRQGAWQTTMGPVLFGKTLGVFGLGKIGQRVCEIGRAFGMKTIAWSQNLTPEAAAAAGVAYVERDQLFAESDVLSVHVVLSPRTTGVIGAREFGLMKPTAYVVNTSRGPIIQEAALIEALAGKRIAGAAIDVYDQEPLPADSPLRHIDRLTITPHLGYVTIDNMRVLYEDTVEALGAYLKGQPVRLLEP